MNVGLQDKLTVESSWAPSSFAATAFVVLFVRNRRICKLA